LVVGINHYAPDSEFLEAQNQRGLRLDTSRRWSDLDGAVNDASHVAQLLSARYGFKDVTVLPNEKATREAILQGLARLAQAKPEDRVVFYYSGHGSQAPNRQARNTTHTDQTIVPVDAPFGAPEIHDKELKLCFNRILDACPNLTVVVDACHSRSIARSPFLSGKSRALPARESGKTGAEPPGLEAITKQAISERDPVDRGALVLQACDANQTAKETLSSGGDPRGAFSLALTETMKEVREGEPAGRIFQRVAARMRVLTMDQEPHLEASPARRASPLFGGHADAVGGTVVPVLPRSGYLAGNQLELAGGFAIGIVQGVTLRQVSTRGNQPAGTVEVRVTEVVGPERCRAAVTRGTASAVKAGTMFRLNDRQTVSNFVLRLWAPPAVALPEAQWALVKGLRTHGAAAQLVTTEPAAATHVLSWDAGAWRLQGLVGEPTTLGPQPTADTVLQAVKASARYAAASGAGVGRPSKLFVSIPPDPQVMAAVRKQAAKHPTLGFNGDADSADYHLMARAVGDEVEYAWVRPQLRPAVGGLPRSTGWVAGAPLNCPDTLLYKARTLAKIKGWLDLRSTADSGRFPYTLRLQALRPGGGVKPKTRLLRGGRLREGEFYRAVLHADRKPKASDEKRYVYVFEIDDSGRSQLVFPLSNHDGSGVFPAEEHIAAGQQTIPISDPFPVVEPFGADTFFMLSTVTPLNDPNFLSFPGVKDISTERGSPFERLLEEIGSGTRGVTVGGKPIDTPPSWAIERLNFMSVPTR
jgi:hypothetical protein